ncbi:MAG: glycosyltransferase [Longispora sp.]|nr:glycosyltransferase [Longispora sp. (in: high G+C Gram-positive bacteria)]
MEAAREINLRAFPEESEEKPDLVVLSHLRWDWVWQRPQHLISRLGRGRRTWFVEEPILADVSHPELRHVNVGEVERVWLDVPRDWPETVFEERVVEAYSKLLPDLLGHAASGSVVWLYSPLALELAETLRPRQLIYDVMDDLSAFSYSNPRLPLMQREALRQADVVFAGGNSLYRMAVAARGSESTHLFPSGVETEHYAKSRSSRRSRDRQAAGYVGVLDERLDWSLIAEMAAALPDWDINLIGPMIKVDPTSLPKQPNLHYLGMQPYEKLPELMVDLDVALMPFALNEATRSISPTKTLEYLVAGLPVVSTRVADVVADTLNNRIRRIDRQGIVTTIAGDGEPGFSGDGGQASAAQLFQPGAVTVDTRGNFIFSDTLNNRVRQFRLLGS